MLYYLNNERSNEIINKYHLDPRWFFVPMDERLKGLNLLKKHTIKTLNEIYRRDPMRLLISIEAFRFLNTLIWFQNYPTHEYIPFYEAILAWFHRKKQLLFKKQLTLHTFQSHRKKPVVYLKIQIGDKAHLHKYHMNEHLIDDFGTKYKADEFIKYRDKYDIYSLDGLNNIM